MKMTAPHPFSTLVKSWAPIRLYFVSWSFAIAVGDAVCVGVNDLESLLYNGPGNGHRPTMVDDVGDCIKCCRGCFIEVVLC